MCLTFPKFFATNTLARTLEESPALLPPLPAKTSNKLTLIVNCMIIIERRALRAHTASSSFNRACKYYELSLDTGSGGKSLKGFNSSAKSNRQFFLTQTNSANPKPVRRRNLTANFIVQGKNKDIFFAQRNLMNTMEIARICGGNRSQRPKSAVIYNSRFFKTQKPKHVVELIRQIRNNEYPIHRNMIKISELLNMLSKH
eukprot:TRINITY_DN14410_c0_g1_i2.p1 TRINITY_DN14410_c0_g1~~TRINITY_DN14410_c0_g1_i2.p1  ORF type:complete len:200 (-),score=3.01 TRINITY_DN14410_c0_g1_i2:221-820(-)